MLRETAHCSLHSCFVAFPLHAYLQAQPCCLWHRCLHLNKRSSSRHGADGGGAGDGDGGEGGGGDGGGGLGDGGGGDGGGKSGGGGDGGGCGQ